MKTMNSPREADAAAVRAARFGTLPEHIALADTIEEKPVFPANATTEAFNPDEAAARYACVDLG